MKPLSTVAVLKRMALRGLRGVVVGQRIGSEWRWEAMAVLLIT
jgi:hypothetical protein